LPEDFFTGERPLGQGKRRKVKVQRQPRKIDVRAVNEKRRARAEERMKVYAPKRHPCPEHGGTEAASDLSKKKRKRRNKKKKAPAALPDRHADCHGSATCQTCVFKKFNEMLDMTPE